MDINIIISRTNGCQNFDFQTNTDYQLLACIVILLDFSVPKLVTSFSKSVSIVSLRLNAIIITPYVSQPVVLEKVNVNMYY